MLPTGIAYIPGSLSELTQFNVQEQNTNNTHQPVFVSNDIPSGDSLKFSISVYATVSAVDHLLQGNTFRNNVSISYEGGSMNHSSTAYNLLYAALNIISVDPTSQALNSGDTYYRNITIVNAGYGKLSNFFITDNRNHPGLLLDSSNVGTLSATGDTVFLTASDFANVGNGDAFFDSNESITILKRSLLRDAKALQLPLH